MMFIQFTQPREVACAISFNPRLIAAICKVIMFYLLSIYFPIQVDMLSDIAIWKAVYVGKQDILNSLNNSKSESYSNFIIQIEKFTMADTSNTYLEKCIDKVNEFVNDTLSYRICCQTYENSMNKHV